MKTYEINATDCNSPLDGQWSGQRWDKIPHLDIALFHQNDNDHKPVTKAKLAYNSDSIFGIFKVDDNYIRSTTTKLQESVCQDSCVEFFFKPKTDAGYFNFEFNAGGNMLCHYATDPSRGPDGKITACQDVALADQVEIFHSLPAIIDPEITTPTTWLTEFKIPFSILEPYCGTLGNVAGTEWRANLYKCGDQTSHPHWASWAPLTTLDFHLPECFAPITFE
ncbi:MAG: carbohydrate-binding family 9-like protein [Kiritimatiellae bacterium]|nr:carbohydrate-binding family 9-like protein [Kiritimatiellia bacterium]